MIVSITFIGTYCKLTGVFHPHPRFPLLFCELLTEQGGCWYSRFCFNQGGVAQSVEQAAHIRLVRGSSPFATTIIQLNRLVFYRVLLLTERWI